MNILRCGAGLVLAGLVLFGLGACSKSAPSGAESAEADHAHTAPHGGWLVEVGDHEFNLEVLHDPTAGKLTVWLLDAHAENFVRLPLPELELNLAMVGPLKLAAVANATTGETVGDTSQFEVVAPALRAPGPFVGLLLPMEIRGKKFGPVEVQVAPPAAIPAEGVGSHDGHSH